MDMDILIYRCIDVLYSGIQMDINSMQALPVIKENDHVLACMAGLSQYYNLTGLSQYFISILTRSQYCTP